MKFICENRHLLKTVSSTDLIIKSRLTFSNFASLLIEAKSNRIVVTGTNGNLFQIATINAEVEEEGKITISQMRLFNLLKQLPDGKIVFSIIQDYFIEIKPLESKRRMDTKLLGMSADDFPSCDSYPSEVKSISLDKSYFKKMIQKVSFAVASQATKYALNGVLLEFKENKVNLVASDSRRLAVFNTLVPDLNIQEEKIILSHELLNQLLRLFVLDGSLSFCYKEEKIFFKFDEFIIYDNLINGEYPNYQMFLPQTHEYSFNCNTNDLVKALALTTAILQGDNDPTHKIVLTLTKNELELSTQVDNYGEVKEKIEVSYDKEDLKIGLNAKMITEILRQIETDELEVSFNNVTSPILIKERNRNEYVYVIMPIKLGDDLK